MYGLRLGTRVYPPHRCLRRDHPCSRVLLQRCTDSSQLFLMWTRNNLICLTTILPTCLLLVPAKAFILRVLTSSVFVQKMTMDTQEMDSLALLRFGRSSDNVAPFVLPTNPLELVQIASSELCLDIRCQVLLTCAALSASLHPIPPLWRICHFHVNRNLTEHVRSRFA